MKKDEKEDLSQIDLTKFMKGFGQVPMRPGQIGEIRVSGLTVKVFVMSNRKMEGYRGRLYLRKRTPEIWLNVNLTKPLREITILHELVHLTVFFTCKKMSEQEVISFTLVLFGALKDNFNINLNRLKYKCY